MTLIGSLLRTLFILCYVCAGIVVFDKIPSKYKDTYIIVMVFLFVYILSNI